MVLKFGLWLALFVFGQHLVSAKSKKDRDEEDYDGDYDYDRDSGVHLLTFLYTPRVCRNRYPFDTAEAPTGSRDKKLRSNKTVQTCRLRKRPKTSVRLGNSKICKNEGKSFGLPRSLN
jgi:hypothetical protein